MKKFAILLALLVPSMLYAQDTTKVELRVGDVLILEVEEYFGPPIRKSDSGTSQEMEFVSEVAIVTNLCCSSSAADPGEICTGPRCCDEYFPSGPSCRSLSTLW